MDGEDLVRNAQYEMGMNMFLSARCVILSDCFQVLLPYSLESLLYHLPL